MKKNYVLDTNVLLHDPRAIFKFEDNDVVLPIFVIEEIDQFKREGTERGRNARTISRLLDEQRGDEGSLARGVPLDGGGTLRILIPEKRPQLGVGYTRLRYEESAAFAQDGDDVDDTFNGFHVVGGVEVRLFRWVGLGGDVVWTSVADAIGEGGASKAFGEDNLGGTSLRVKLVIGR